MRSRLHRRFAFQDGDEARDHFALVQATMEKAQRFTAVPGKGMVLVGLSALFVAAVSARIHSAANWLATWGLEFLIALVISLYTMAQKCGGWKNLLHSPSSKRCVLVLLPTAISGFATTLLAVRFGWIRFAEPVPAWLPGLWLLFYGAAVFSGGTVSLREVRELGALLFATGILSCLFLWPAWITTALGFGLLHILFGARIWRRHES